MGDGRRATNFGSLDYIGFSESLFSQYSFFVDSTVFHEFGHNWDEQSENPFINQFRSISDWDRTRDPGDTLSGDGFWWYNDTPDDFFRSYATTNPREDYAVSFAYYFRNEIGDYVYDSATGPTPAKFDNIERFLNTLGTA